MFFDEWFEHEILGSDMDVLLQRFYHERSLLVVVHRFHRLHRLGGKAGPQISPMTQIGCRRGSTDFTDSTDWGEGWFTDFTKSLGLG